MAKAMKGCVGCPNLGRVMARLLRTGGHSVDRKLELGLLQLRETLVALQDEYQKVGLQDAERSSSKPDP